MLGESDQTLIFVIVGISYNQPKFSVDACWNPNATTIADVNDVGSEPWGLFVDVNNNLYVASQVWHRVFVWRDGSAQPSRDISLSSSFPLSVFATSNGDIYVDNKSNGRRVERWTLDNRASVAIENTPGKCFGLFVDQNDSIYCSLGDFHRVIRAAKNEPNRSVTIAGNGSNGSVSNMLNEPNGIFVDLNFTLFVADCRNHRVQRFFLNERNGHTVVGSGSSHSITLSCPRSVVIDGDGYLFVADTWNHRLIRGSAEGYACIVGCSGSSGSGAHQFQVPIHMSFDADGNIYVVDHNNHRIQKFFQNRNQSCRK